MSACWSPTLMLPWRTDGSAFAATRYAIAPSPWPLAFPVIAIQLAVLDADHEHSRDTLTFTIPVPPAAPKLDDELLIDGAHRVAVGPVTFVTPELPQPIAIAIAAASTKNSRGWNVVFTATRLSSSGPATMER